MIAGALVAAGYKLGPDGRGVLARIAGPLGVEVRAAAAELAACDAMAGKRLRADWIASARAPAPAGMRSMHPSWVEAELAGLPLRARSAVAAVGGRDPVDVWLARWTTAGFVAMPAAVAAARPITPGDVGGLDGHVVLAWLSCVGADQLAYVLSAAGAEKTIQTLPVAVRDATERIRRPPRIGHLGPLRAAIELCDIHRGDLVRIGASAVAAHLTPVVRKQMIARLPHAVGASLGIVLDAGALRPLERCPTWTAIAAD